MASQEPVVKPKRRKARIDRLLKKREPQIVEGTKRCLVMRGHHTSATIVEVLRDIARIKKPDCTSLNRKNEVLPFEDANSIEFLTEKNNCGLFALGSHSKKRPNNLVMGRTFDGHVLDMVEFGVDHFLSMTSISGSTKAIGAKPMMAFIGSQWDSDSQYARIQSLLLDFFRGTKLEMLNLQGIDHVMVCTVIDGKIHVRTYSINFKKSGTRIPDVSLADMGPHIDMVVRRCQLASDDMWKTACRQPKSAKPPKVKNMSTGVLGTTVGRIHMKKQNLDKMGGRRVDALRVGRAKRVNASDEDGLGPATGDTEGGSKKKRKISSIAT